ncbi:hypothetical protein [Sporisorium scitamineum]|uniref:Uncharacterized protein n=1 Tax=Sporisorium scitamineum TaxID=49012 RepID=A0A0F7RZI1_9BASI|nr:hypothetical protein [Sporisorium scitamineum]
MAIGELPNSLGFPHVQSHATIMRHKNPWDFSSSSGPSANYMSVLFERDNRIEAKRGLGATPSSIHLLLTVYLVQPRSQFRHGDLDEIHAIISGAGGL